MATKNSVTPKRRRTEGSLERSVLQRRLSYYEAQLKRIAYLQAHDFEEYQHIAAHALFTPDDELPPLENND